MICSWHWVMLVDWYVNYHRASNLVSYMGLKTFDNYSSQMGLYTLCELVFGALKYLHRSIVEHSLQPVHNILLSYANSNETAYQTRCHISMAIGIALGTILEPKKFTLQIVTSHLCRPWLWRMFIKSHKADWGRFQGNTYIQHWACGCGERLGVL